MVKVNWSSTSVESYSKFKKTNPNTRVSKAQFTKILRLYNRAVCDFLMETGEAFCLPQGVGELRVCKYKRRKPKLGGDLSKNPGYAIDWANTAKLGKVVYHNNLHSQGYAYRLLWNFKTSMLPFREYYVFKPCRRFNRALAKKIKEPGYQERDVFREWFLRRQGTY